MTYLVSKKNPAWGTGRFYWTGMGWSDFRRDAIKLRADAAAAIARLYSAELLEVYGK